MADEPKGSGTTEGKDSYAEDEAVVRAALEEEGDDEVDEDGKALPWNHPKRLRKVYEGSKEGRKAVKALKELGLKHSDLPQLRDALTRLQQYDRAYAEYLSQERAGTTDEDDDEGAKETQKKITSLKKQLKSLGVKFEEDSEVDEQKRQAQTLAARKAEVVGRARDRITELLEDAGVDFKSMDAQDKKDLLEEFDFKIGQKMSRDQEAIQAFIRGSVRPVEKYFKEVVKTASLPVKKGAKANFSQLPPRMSHSHPGSALRKTEPSKAKSVREVSDEIVADLKARNAARRAEEQE